MTETEYDDEKAAKIRSAEQKHTRQLLILVAVMLFGAGCVIHNQGSGRDGPSLSRPAMVDVGNNLVKAKGTPDAGGLTTEEYESLESARYKLDRKVRMHKDNLPAGVFMETQPEALALTKELQDATRKMLLARYGTHDKYFVKVDVEFPPSIEDYATNGATGSLLIELADISKVPVSVYNFMEIARTHIKGGFHRNAGHVVQASANSKAVRQRLSFQEYSKDVPHEKMTTGYAGRPSGPGWYVSLKDNSRAHGPGSQQHQNPHEADARFGKVVEGFEETAMRFREQTKAEGFLPKGKCASFVKMTILVGEDRTPWVPSKNDLEAITDAAELKSAA